MTAWCTSWLTTTPVPCFESAEDFAARVLIDDDDVFNLFDLLDEADAALPPQTLSPRILKQRIEMALEPLRQAAPEDDEASSGAFLSATRVVPQDRLPVPVLERAAELLRDGGLYCWQDTPPLLAKQSHRGLRHDLNDILARAAQGSSWLRCPNEVKRLLGLG